MDGSVNTAKPILDLIFDFLFIAFSLNVAGRRQLCEQKHFGWMDYIFISPKVKKIEQMLLAKCENVLCGSMWALQTRNVKRKKSISSAFISVIEQYKLVRSDRAHLPPASLLLAATLFSLIRQSSAS